MRILGRRIPLIGRLVLLIIAIIVSIILVFLLPAISLQRRVLIRVVLACPVLRLLWRLLALGHVLLSLAVLLFCLFQQSASLFCFLSLFAILDFVLADQGFRTFAPDIFVLAELADPHVVFCGARVVVCVFLLEATLAFLHGELLGRAARTSLFRWRRLRRLLGWWRGVCVSGLLLLASGRVVGQG